MRCSSVVLPVFVLLLASNGFSADPDWVGDYANKKFLNGQAAFQLTIEQSGDAMQVSFDAGYTDGHGAAPDGQGEAKITGDKTLQFQWEDSFKNAGTGKITRVGTDIVVSMKTTRVVDSRCLPFYGKKMRLKPAKRSSASPTPKEAVLRALHHWAKTTDDLLQASGNLA